MDKKESGTFTLSLSRVREIYRLNYKAEACIVQCTIIERFCKYMLFCLYRKDKRNRKWGNVIKMDWATTKKDLKSYLLSQKNKQLANNIERYYEERKKILHHFVGGLKDFSSNKFISDGEDIYNKGKIFLKSKGLLKQGVHKEELNTSK